MFIIEKLNILKVSKQKLYILLFCITAVKNMDPSLGLQSCYQELFFVQRRFDDIAAKREKAIRAVESTIRHHPDGADPNEFDDFQELKSILETYNQCSAELETVKFKLLRLRCMVGTK